MQVARVREIGFLTFEGRGGFSSFGFLSLPFYFFLFFAFFSLLLLALAVIANKENGWL